MVQGKLPPASLLTAGPAGDPAAISLSAPPLHVLPVPLLLNRETEAGPLRGHLKTISTNYLPGTTWFFFFIYSCPLSVKEQLSMTLVKNSKKDDLREISAMGCGSDGERSGSTLNIGTHGIYGPGAKLGSENGKLIIGSRLSEMEA